MPKIDERTFKLVVKGAYPSTFLQAGQAAQGQKID